MVIWSNAWCKLGTIVKSILYCSDLVWCFFLLTKKLKQEKWQIIPLFIYTSAVVFFFPPFTNFSNSGLVVQHAVQFVVSPDIRKTIQSTKLLPVWKTDNSVWALWCLTVCFIKSIALPHALDHPLLSQKSANRLGILTLKTKLSKQLLNLNV